MTPNQLLEELSSRGARLEVNGERLRVQAPAGAVTDGLKAALRRDKPTLIKLLRTRPDSGKPSRGAPGPNPPKPTGQLDEDVALALSKFAQHGISPAPDDLRGVVWLERKRTWCEATLDAVYRGQMTLYLDMLGRVSAFPRTEVV
jgi:hypothetical protein